MRKALFTGTFDPFTIGHDAIIRRALACGLANEVVIGIGINNNKKTLFGLDERLEAIRRIYIGEPRVKVTSYDGLTVDFAAEIKADFILRGIRNLPDYEYEKNNAEINRLMSGIETVFLFTEPSLEHISSSLVRELLKYKKDISHLIPTTK